MKMPYSSRAFECTIALATLLAASPEARTEPYAYISIYLDNTVSVIDTGVSVRPSASITTSAPGYVISRRHHATQVLAVYAPSCLSPSQNAKLASSGWLDVAG